MKNNNYFNFLEYLIKEKDYTPAKLEALGYNSDIVAETFGVVLLNLLKDFIDRHLED
jgi:hypothetical protein